MQVSFYNSFPDGRLFMSVELVARSIAKGVSELAYKHVAGTEGLPYLRIEKPGRSCRSSCLPLRSIRAVPWRGNPPSHLVRPRTCARRSVAA